MVGRKSLHQSDFQRTKFLGWYVLNTKIVRLYFMLRGEHLSCLVFFFSGESTVTISRYKHLHTNAPAHCYGEQCIEYHKMQLANTSIPVRFIKDTLQLLEKQADGIASILEELKVPHLKVLYEKLYYAKRADQWMDIFRFVGVGPMSGLTMDHVRAVSPKMLLVLGTTMQSHKYSALTLGFVAAHDAIFNACRRS